MCKPTSRKETVIFPANEVKIVGFADEDKYQGHVPSQTLSHPSALCGKCEMDTQRNQLNAVREVHLERQMTPSAQLRLSLAALKENVDRRVRVSPFPHATGADRATKYSGILLQDLFGRRSGNLFRRCFRR